MTYNRHPHRGRSHFGQRLLLVLITVAIVLLLGLAGCGWLGYRVTVSEKSLPNMRLDGIHDRV